MDWEKFKRIIAIMFARYADEIFEFLDNEIQFTIESSVYSFTKEEFYTISSNLSQYTISAASIYTPHKIEMLIEPLEPRYGYRFQEEGTLFADEMEFVKGIFSYLRSCIAI